MFAADFETDLTTAGLPEASPALAGDLAAELPDLAAADLATALTAGLAGVLAAGLATGFATGLTGAFLAVDTGEAFLGAGFLEDADGLATVLALAGLVDFLAGMSILEQQKGVSAGFESSLTGQWQGFQAS